jgi:hypothetical protein
MTSKSLLVRLGLAAVLAAAVGAPAKAGIIPVSVTVLPEAGNYMWTYSIVLPSNMKLQSGDYFTIYDFAGLVSGSANVSATNPDSSYANNWGFSTAKTGPTPNRLNPGDDPNIDNLTWTYNGPTINVDGNITLGNFSATSAYNQQGDSFLTATNSRAADGAVDSNITETVVPVGTSTGGSTTPEPTTLLMAGLGLPLVGLRRFLRRKVAA